jgi:hypothetical protein
MNIFVFAGAADEADLNISGGGGGGGPGQGVVYRVLEAQAGNAARDAAGEGSACAEYEEVGG